MTLWCQGDLKKVIIHNCNLFCFEIAMMVQKYSIWLIFLMNRYKNQNLEDTDIIKVANPPQKYTHISERAISLYW